MSTLTQIGIAIGAFLLLILIGFGAYLYIDHLKNEITVLQAQGEVAAKVTADNAAVDKRILEDAKRQSDILAQERNSALARVKTLEQRYQQIMETPDAENAVISPVLCDSLIRLYEPTSTANGGALSVQHPKPAASAGNVAKPSCGKMTQKDVAAWLETEVYPAFKLMQQNFIDLNRYAGEQAK